MIMVISPGRQSIEPLLCQECINVICREGRNILIYWTVKSFRVPQAARFPEEPPFSS